MASAVPKISTQTFNLGIVPRGTAIVFKVHTGTGFLVDAMLTLKAQTLATWVTSELVGIQISEALVSPGFHMLDIICTFTSKKATTVTIDFSLGNNAQVFQAIFTGKANEIASATAAVIVT